MPVDNGNLLEEPFIIAHFVYNNNRKRLHTPRRHNESSAHFNHCSKARQKFARACPLSTTMTHQHSMPTVNVSIVLGNVLEESIVLWEPLGTFWRNLLFFGNIYCLPQEPCLITTIDAHGPFNPTWSGLFWRSEVRGVIIRRKHMKMAKTDVNHLL